MSQNNKVARTSNEENSRSSIAKGIAQKGIYSTRDLANVSLALGMDILYGKLGSRDGTAIGGLINQTRKNIELGQKIGEHKHVTDIIVNVEEEECSQDADEELLKQREAELKAELEAIKQRRKIK